MLAEEAAANAAAGPRWIAEPVALSPEEAAISLEAEMFRTFGTMPATIPAAAPGGEIEPVRIPSVSAIAAAVENRLAEAGLAATSTSWEERGAERCSSEHGSETTAAEMPAVEAPGEVMTSAPNAASSLMDGSAAEKIAPEIAAEIAQEKIEAEIEPEIAAEIAPKTEQENVEAEKIEAAQEDSPVKVAEEVPEEEVAAATFADAVCKDEIEVTGEENREPVSGTATAVATPVTAEENQDSSSDVGCRESMCKAVIEKSGKSKWHQIRTTPSAAANSDVVDAAKQAEPAAEEAPKAMAAAAAAQGSATSSPAAPVPDASTIASIVDSIMADLRPKIVEEIARKLAGK